MALKYTSNIPTGPLKVSGGPIDIRTVVQSQSDLMGSDLMKYVGLVAYVIDDEELEKTIKKDIYSDILLGAKAQTRHEKLLEIIDNIENKQFHRLKPILSEMEPIDIAEILNDVDEEKMLIIFRLLPKDLASDTFVELDTDTQMFIIKSFSDNELSKITTTQEIELYRSKLYNYKNRVIYIMNNSKLTMRFNLWQKMTVYQLHSNAQNVAKKII